MTHNTLHVGIRRLFLGLFALLLTGSQLLAAPINIPLSGNAYLTSNPRGAKIDNNGLVEWSDPNTTVSTWLRINQAGTMSLSLRAKVAGKGTKLQVTVEGRVYPLELNSEEWTVYPIADNVQVGSTGYMRIDIKGVAKAGQYFAEVTDLIVDGTALSVAPNYVHDFSSYFGRRGPSVHLKYEFPQDTDIEYFYNEVTVPQGEDVIGSYYMANGFGQGYFGIQANSEKERRVLFSVWSPFDTQDPKLIPEADRIKKLRQGEGVHIGEFGNEGSGGQSYLVYPWKAGVTYKFLMHIHPDGKGSTIYTAYFYATDESRWRLIASFLRPKTDTWYKSPYSFLENFIPNQGYVTRKVLFGNQWAVTSKGKWVEIADAKFTYDATAKAQVRTDYRGGKEGDKLFYLQNCGFFDQNTLYDSSFTRMKDNNKPKVNCKALKAIPSISK